MAESDYFLLAAAQEEYQRAIESRLPSRVYKPRIYIDGNQWCALYGDNIQDGVAGVGDTPEAAMTDFDRNWHGQPASKAGIEVEG